MGIALDTYMYLRKMSPFKIEQLDGTANEDGTTDNEPFLELRVGDRSFNVKRLDAQRWSPAEIVARAMVALNADYDDGDGRDVTDTEWTAEVRRAMAEITGEIEMETNEDEYSNDD